MGSTAGQVALGAGLVAAGIALTAAGQPWGMTLVSAGVGIGLGAASAALAPTPEVPKPGAINRQVRSASAAEQIVYGRGRVGGAIVAIDRHTVQRSGPDADYLDLVVVVSARPIEGFQPAIFLGEDYVPLVTNPGGSAGDPFVPVGMLIPALGSKYRRYLGVEFYDGNQVAASQFMINRRDDDGVNRAPRIQWTSEHRLRGYAYAVVTLRYKQDIYAAGIPTMSFDVKGVRPYDPRSGLSAWTDNAALCIADYLASEYGPPGVTYSDINEPALIAAANICDEEVEHDLAGVVIPGIETTAVTEARYRISAVISATEDWRQAAPKLAMTMAGGIFRVGAGWFIIAGAETAATAQLGPDDMVDEIDVLPRRSRRELFNRIQALSRNEHDKHQVFDAPPLAPNRYFLQDAGTILVNAIDLTSTVASPTQAMRIASIELEQNRQQITATGTFKWRALTVEVGDVVEISSDRFGWTDKPFRVVRWELDLEEGVRLGLAEYCDAVYAYPPDTALLDCYGGTDLLLPPAEFNVTNVFVVREDVGDSTITWAAPLSPDVTGYEARWKPVGEVPGDGYAFGNLTYIELEADPAPDWVEDDVDAVTFEIEADMDPVLVYRVEVRSVLEGGLYGDYVFAISFPKPEGTP